MVWPTRSQIFALSLVILVNFGLVWSQSVLNDEPTDLCIGCICEAASRCNRTVQCVNGMCGMFKITNPYWIDAGRPVIAGDDPANPEAWVRCVTDPFCAGQTVVGYMTKYKQDCNSDGRISCHDYAFLHNLGGFGCGTRAPDKKFIEEFLACIKDGSVQ